MQECVCKNCGGNSFTINNEYKICDFCGSKFIISKEERNSETKISINDDIKELLNKCNKDPLRAKKYANLILDIDPFNEEAIKILNNK